LPQTITLRSYRSASCPYVLASRRHHTGPAGRCNASVDGGSGRADGREQRRVVARGRQYRAVEAGQTRHIPEGSIMAPIKAVKISPYAAVAKRLIDMGYSAIPVLPGSKRPGQYSKGVWYGENDWQRFGDRLPKQYEITIWSNWPDAGVCVVLDDVVKVVDIDSDDEDLIASVLAALPACSVRKRGAKGFSLFYRGSADIVSRPFNIKPNGASRAIRAVDLLAKGRQTVLPPTVHP